MKNTAGPRLQKQEDFLMKLQNHKFARTLAAAAVATCAVAMLSVGAFAADVAIGEKDPTYGGYGAPAGPAIQGNIMLIGADGAESDALKLNYSVKGLLGRQVLYTARQNGTVLTLDVPASVATFRCTMEDLTTMMNNGINTLVFKTEKTSTTLNLTLLCEGQKASTKVTLRHLGSSAVLHVGLRCRRDLLVGRDSNYGGYASPVENPIQGNVMMISDTLVEKSEARYTVKGFLGKQVLYTTYYNMGKTQSATFSGYASWSPFTNTRLVANTWGGYSHFSDGQGLKNHGWNISVYAQLQQTIAKTWTASASVFKMTPGVNLQGKTMGYFSHTLSLQKSMLNDRLNITFTADNPFQKYYHIKSNSSGKNFATSSSIKFIPQSFSIGVSYRIGKLQSGVKKTERTITNDDVKSGGGGGGKLGGDNVGS